MNRPPQQSGAGARRGTRPWLLTPLVVVGGLALTACGPEPAVQGATHTNTTSVPETVPTTLTPAAAIADTFCADFLDAIAANGPLPVAGFDPDHPRADQLPAVGAHFQPAADATERLAQELRSVGDDQHGRSTLARFVAALAAENANSRAQLDAALAADVAAFTATLGHVGALRTARVEAAVALGASHCAEW